MASALEIARQKRALKEKIADMPQEQLVLLLNALMEMLGGIGQVKGLHGNDADPKTVAKLLKNNQDFINTVRGEPGKDAEALEVAKILVRDKKFLNMVRGEDGTSVTLAQVVG